MLKWSFMLVMLLSLVACDSGSQDAAPDESAPEPVALGTEPLGLEDIEVLPNPVATLQDGESPAEARRPGQVLQPGLRDAPEVNIIDARAYLNAESTIGWVAVLVENITDEPLDNIAVNVSLLDDQNRNWQSIRLESPFQNIPSGLAVPLMVVFVPPPNYADVAVIAQPVSYPVRGPVGDLRGVYDLSATVDPVPDADFPYTVAGRMTNNSGQVLRSPLAELSFFNAEGDLLGAFSGIIDGVAEDGTWPPGTALTFQANVLQLAEGDVAEVRVTGAGYALAE